MKNNLFTLAYFEATGTIIGIAFMFTLKIPSIYYAYVPIFAFPIGSAFDLIGSLAFKKIRDIPFGYDLKKPLELPGSKKEEFLTIINMHRSIFIAAFIILFLNIHGFQSQTIWLSIFGLSTFIIVFSFFQILRFEKYIKNQLYSKKDVTR